MLFQLKGNRFGQHLLYNVWETSNDLTKSFNKVLSLTTDSKAKQAGVPLFNHAIYLWSLWLKSDCTHFAYFVTLPQSCLLTI